MYMFNNYNLGLCKKCYDKEDIEMAEMIDDVTHKVTCPKCKAIYGMEIVDKKCKTKDCPVSFFWDTLDCIIFARWIK